MAKRTLRNRISLLWFRLWRSELRRGSSLKHWHRAHYIVSQRGLMFRPN